MPKELFSRFLELVRSEPAIQNQLRNAKDQNTLAQISVSIGAERGLFFTVEDVLDRINDITGGSRELSDAELEAVAGAGAISETIGCDS